jgi:hypothetical protein
MAPLPAWMEIRGIDLELTIEEIWGYDDQNESGGADCRE